MKYKFSLFSIPSKKNYIASLLILLLFIGCVVVMSISTTGLEIRFRNEQVLLHVKINPGDSIRNESIVNHDSRLVKKRYISIDRFH